MRRYEAVLYMSGMRLSLPPDRVVVSAVSYIYTRPFTAANSFPIQY